MAYPHQQHQHQHQPQYSYASTPSSASPYPPNPNTGAPQATSHPYHAHPPPHPTHSAAPNTYSNHVPAHPQPPPTHPPAHPPTHPPLQPHSHPTQVHPHANSVLSSSQAAAAPSASTPTASSTPTSTSTSTSASTASAPASAAASLLTAPSSCSSPYPGVSATATRIADLVASIHPDEKLDPQVELLLLDVADSFIDDLITASCDLAKHRQSNTVDVKDVKAHMERSWHVLVPGYGSDVALPTRRQPMEAHRKRLHSVNKSRGREIRTASSSLMNGDSLDRAQRKRGADQL